MSSSDILGLVGTPGLFGLRSLPAWLVALEAEFHPHDPATSPLGLATQHFRDHMAIPVATCVAYVALIAYGLYAMKERPAWHLKKALAVWNSLLAVFSVIGAARTTPVLVATLLDARQTTGTLAAAGGAALWRASLCKAAHESYGAGACGLWVQLFVVSKFAELLDTAFIVLRKRKLLFLHWFHHWSVLLYCWHSYATEAPHALYFVAMNYSVHAVMYSYYALMALSIKPTWIPPELITAAQITQMVVGVAVQMAATHERWHPKGDCVLADRWNLIFGAAMYASYLLLFVKFAVERYVLHKYKRGKVIKILGGHDKREPASFGSAFPVITTVLNSFKTRVRKSISWDFKKLSQVA